MGRVLLAALTDLEVDTILAESDLRPHTPNTLCDPDGIKAELKKARDQGWYLLDEELELGIRAVAAPIRDERGRVVAAISVFTTVARSTKQKIIREIVPPLLATAEEIFGGAEDQVTMAARRVAKARPGLVPDLPWFGAPDRCGERRPEYPAS